MEELKASLPDLTDDQYQLLNFGLVDADQCLKMVGDLYDPGLTVKEIREELERVKKNLINAQQAKNAQLWQARLIKALDYLPRSVLLILDTYDREIFSEKPLGGSGFKELAMRLPNEQVFNVLFSALEALQAEIITPGKGNARKQAKRFIPAIHCLARWFKDVLPNSAISADEKSAFYRYVALYLEKHIGATDPGRHIKNAIQDYSNWKQII
ncbi:MAG: hypothetical protein IBX55_18270 [Methyloprofundus sp.]|nr:hypothetical protein [Methyloprofundus sp.]